MPPQKPPERVLQYWAFVDPSDGSADSMTLAIAHRDGLFTVLARGGGRRFRSSAEALRNHVCDCDRYTGEWPRERFKEHGITYLPSANPKSDIYRDFLPLLNSRRVWLLDNERLLTQLSARHRQMLKIFLRQVDSYMTDELVAQPRAIVLDTLARCMGEGDENTAGDMGRFVERCGIIERRLGCVVVVIHHTGKDASRGARGSNALGGAVDATIIIEKSDHYSTARVDEMKDGPEGQEWRFSLVPYDISDAKNETSETPPKPQTKP